MEAISSSAQTTPGQLSRVQLGVVLTGYASVLLLSAALVFWRHLQYVMHANDVDASGGMWAFGDLLLELFIAGLFLVPTLLLAFFVRKSETAYTRYSQALLGIASTAPICIGAMAIPAIGQNGSGFLGMLGWLCLGRVSASPVFLVGLFFSRLFARSKRAKRLIKYAFLIEVGTYVLLLAGVMLPWHKMYVECGPEKGWFCIDSPRTFPASSAYITSLSKSSSGDPMTARSSALALLCSLLLTAATPLTRAQTQDKEILPLDKITNQAELDRTVTALDAALFDAYNTCNLEKFGSFIDENIEFYHDKTGSSFGRAPLVAAIKENICGKVTRELVVGTLKVYPMRDYGALELGVHRFHHPGQVPDTLGEASFIMLWQYKDGAWKITRVISYDHHLAGK
jgi:hypothetical protein